MAVKYNKETSSFHLLAFQKDVELFPVIKQDQAQIPAQNSTNHNQPVMNQQQQQPQYFQQQQQQQQQFDSQQQQQFQSQQQSQFVNNNFNSNSIQQQGPVFGAPVYSNDRSVMSRGNYFNSSIPSLILPLSMQSQTNQYQLSQYQQQQNQQSQCTTKEEFAVNLQQQITQVQQILQVFKEVMNNCRSNQEVIESKELQDLKLAVDNNYRVLGQYTEVEVEEKQMETLFRIMDESHTATEYYQKICSLQIPFPNKSLNKSNGSQSKLPVNSNNLEMAKGSYVKESKQYFPQDKQSKDYDYQTNISQDLKKTNSSSNSGSSQMSKTTSSDKVSNQSSYNTLILQQQNEDQNSYYSKNNQVQDYNNSINSNNSKPKDQQSQLFLKQSTSNKSDKEILFGDNQAQRVASEYDNNRKKEEEDISLSMLEKKMNNLIALKDSQWDKNIGKEGWKEEFPDVGNKVPRKAYPNPNNMMKLPKQQSQEEVENENMQKKSQLQSELLDDQLCIICYHKESTFALVPCGHKKYCESCAQEMVKKQVCAFCMNPVTQYMRIFS